MKYAKRLAPALVSLLALACDSEPAEGPGFPDVAPAPTSDASPGVDRVPPGDARVTGGSEAGLPDAPLADADATPTEDASSADARVNTDLLPSTDTMPATDARGAGGADGDRGAGGATGGENPPPADMFIHVLPEAGGPDAAPPPDPLIACDADPLLGGLVIDQEGWGHVPAGTDVAYAHNPPGSGPHYNQWVRSGIYAEAIDRRNWVHNLEHGWLVLVHRPDAPAADIRVLTDAWTNGFVDEQCPNAVARRIIVTPDPLLETPVAAITAYRVLAGDHVTPEQLAQMFALCRLGAPELRVCGDGQVPAPPSVPPPPGMQ